MTGIKEAVSPVGTAKPELTISPASINAAPVELDSTSASPDKKRAEKRASREDMLGEMSPAEREKWAKLLEKRKDDPAVLVDIPQTPGAEELETAGAGAEDGSVLSPVQAKDA